MREVALAGVWLVAFIVSFFSVASEQAMAQLLFGGSVWTNGLDWILTIGVPTVAVFLIVLRRFSPDGIRRVGSLGIDQFASVAFSVSARRLAHPAVAQCRRRDRDRRLDLRVGRVGRVLPHARRRGPHRRGAVHPDPPRGLHRAPRDRRAPQRASDPPVSARPPRPERPAEDLNRQDAVAASDADTAAFAAGAYGQTGQHDTYPVAAYGDRPYGESAPTEQNAWAPAQTRDTFEPVDAEPEPQPQSGHQAFWALSPEERDVVDDRGVPIFRVGPTAWALVLEDRGEVFVVRHEDGRVGYLHDVSGVTRG